MSAGLTELTTDGFEAGIKTGVTLVDFWAPWCGPCRMQTPILEQVAKKIGDKGTIAKVNVDEQPDLASKFGVRGIPTLILFKDGKEVKQFVGVQNEATLVKAMAEA